MGTPDHAAEQAVVPVPRSLGAEPAFLDARGATGLERGMCRRRVPDEVPDGRGDGLTRNYEPLAECHLEGHAVLCIRRRAIPGGLHDPEHLSAVFERILAVSDEQFQRRETDGFSTVEARKRHVQQDPTQSSPDRNE